MLLEPQSPNLLVTEFGQKWLEQFDKTDRPMVRQLTDALALVSTQEFERTIQRSIQNLTKDIDGLVALYAAREVPRDTKLNFRKGGSGLNSVSEGSDLGSEARVANIVRQMCRALGDRLLRQPSIESLRERRVSHIVVIDDIIGSGRRTRDYLDQLWNDATNKSWWSYKKIRFTVVTYAGTAEGVRYLSEHPCKPEVKFHRHCPTIDALPWPRAQIRLAKDLCRRYSDSYTLKGNYLGFGSTASLLVFEHGCPNNTSNIFWADSKSKSSTWKPLFPGRASVPETASVFPAEIATRAPISVLLSAGQARVAGALSLVIRRPLSQNFVIILALLARGINRDEAIAHATNLDVSQCKLLLEACIESGLVSPRRRLTEAGMAELKGIATAAKSRIGLNIQLGEDSYYPKSLRSHVVG